MQPQIPKDYAQRAESRLADLRRKRAIMLARRIAREVAAPLCLVAALVACYAVVDRLTSTGGVDLNCPSGYEVYDAGVFDDGRPYLFVYCRKPADKEF